MRSRPSPNACSASGYGGQPSIRSCDAACQPKPRAKRALAKVGGEEGIRTPGGLSTSTVFKTAALNHSATSPRGERRALLPLHSTVERILSGGSQPTLAILSGAGWWRLAGRALHGADHSRMDSAVIIRAARRQLNGSGARAGRDIAGIDRRVVQGDPVRHRVSVAPDDSQTRSWRTRIR